MTKVSEASVKTRAIVSKVEEALYGQGPAVELAVVTFLMGGHLLIEDVPGVGKTTLARALARAIGGEFRRIQFTSDLLPGDITGVPVFDAPRGEFRFRPGPIFGNVVLADEINRATPKTQSALLEAMSEGQVSVDGTPQLLPRPFLVVATQNAEEHHGTYPLPESQLDRFAMRISLGYPGREAERRVVSRAGLTDPVSSLGPVLGPADLPALVAAVDGIHVAPAALDYLMEIVERTRKSRLIDLAVSPRGAMTLHRAARALAVLRDRDFVLADDIKELAVPVLAHRLVPAGAGLDARAGRQTAARAIHEILDAVEIPV